MVSFSCENCGDVLTKKKLDPHRNQCRGASFTCIDCMVHFYGTEYRAHTSCISEAQKYQGALYKEKKAKLQQQQKASQALVPRQAYVEDAVDPDSGAVAIVDAPPHAPSPPPAAYYGEQGALPSVNVFEFLVDSDTPNASKVALPPPEESRMIENNKHQGDEHHRSSSDLVRVNALDFQMDDEDRDYHYVENGFAYGTEPVPPTFGRYDSYANAPQHEPVFHDSAYYTPAPKPKPERDHKQARERETTTVSKQSDKKRKRSDVGQLDMSLVRAQAERDVTMAGTPPILHSGLTGGLNRLLARADFPPSPDYSGAEASPLSPMKRAKQGTSKALARAQRQYEEDEKREREAKLERQRERGRDREPKPRKTSNGTVKEINGTRALVRSKREKSGREERRRRRRSSSSPSPERKSKPMKAIEYSRADSESPAPEVNGNGAVVLHSNGNAFPKDLGARAELFMSFINKGPESERGCSVNKVLKRYHRERYDRWDRELSKPDEEKELWKSLRLKRNDRGEIVLFV
ncbi:uncharacterized protein BDZ99DRAFT_306882 [Mytilinidion resinicola]|uniref:Zinc finger C2H2 LYAR-type domain-containing protein n=1 Tax=Mytilinidion resinicola TaxID=574789 RepID=A0A6A6YNR9_9PEZI|nr:uncharacterized protein BDZ99DRAFT_306882 [Mytilinidion resinicola]KAF2810178.1 hypothetical protein BDZ99DRAFT_306882 [Mytilinidion resinicola]